MVFSTDKFITTIRKQLDGIADDFINDMIHDAIIVATRLKEDDDDALTHMNEISTLAEMCTNMKYDCDTLRMVIKSSFDSNIEWQLPEGDVPYTRNEAPEGTEHASLSYESRKLYHFIRGGNPQITQNKRETMFVQMLEGLHQS